MMAERLAELRRDLDAEAYTSYLPKTVRELLDHIAQLEAQRGELVRELDLTKREAWTAKERHKDEKDRADGLRERLDELNAEDFARSQRGGAVVVPELTAGDIEARLDSTFGTLKGEPENEQAVEWTFKDSRWAYNLAVSRIQPIPADRVLADGMVGVDREELMYLHAFEKYARKHGPESIQDVAGTLDHLRRAQQAKGE